jgi:sigma-54-specific transcriptional regulator
VAAADGTPGKPAPPQALPVVTAVRLPPLRERRGDILPMARHFLEAYRRASGFESVSLSQGAEAALLAHDWPGNIRELENVIHFGLIMSGSGILEATDLRLPQAIDETRTQASSGEDDDGSSDVFDVVGNGLRRLLQSEHEAIHETVERLLLATAFEHCDRNQVRTAKRLGLSRNVVRAQLKRHGLLGQGEGWRVTLPPAQPPSPCRPAECDAAPRARR